MIISYNSLMTTVGKTITVTNQQDDWIKSQIEAGAYTNDSEYIRDLIRRDRANQTKINAIRAALIEGERSGRAEPFDAKTFTEEMLKKHGTSK